MKRREFITFIGGAAAIWPLAAHAQQAGQLSRIGVLMSFAENDASARSMLEGCRRALAQLGWIEGKNLRMEVRWAAGNEQRIKAFARELVDLQPNLILVHCVPHGQSRSDYRTGGELWHSCGLL
jgi:putative tryptophan/tyrosine transport system substrate-binding protein